MYRNRVLHADHRQVLEDGPTTTLAIGSPVLHYTDAAIPGSSPASVVGSDTCGWYCCLDPANHYKSIQSCSAAHRPQSTLARDLVADTGNHPPKGQNALP